MIKLQSLDRTVDDDGYKFVVVNPRRCACFSWLVGCIVEIDGCLLGECVRVETNSSLHEPGEHISIIVSYD